MRQSTLAVLALAGFVAAERQCTGQAYEEGGNWFCGAVSQIVYEGFQTHGSYQDVTLMGGGGECNKADKSFDSAFGPLGEDLSVHVRGPVELKAFAVYNLGGSKKRDTAAQTSPHVHARRHGHSHFHNQRKKKREEWITATIDGQVVSWVNDYFGPAAPTQDATPPPPPPQEPPKEEAPPPSNPNGGVVENPTVVEPAPDSGSGGAWNRVSYYHAEQQVAENLVFLGNYGGAGSGTWDTTWGNSLSYLNAEGNGGADSPQRLNDVSIPSNKEFSIFSGEKCDESCGFSRANDVAYKGFAGGSKIFLFKFKMPLDGDRGFNGDMPAIWLLNARIPRTIQYGGCSCWDKGCGEVDIYEVLASGDTKCKSTFHLNPGAGSSDYFERPVDNYIKVATIFDGGSGKVSIKRIPDETGFDASLDEATVRGWVDVDTSNGGSLFQI